MYVRHTSQEAKKRKYWIEQKRFVCGALTIRINAVSALPLLFFYFFPFFLFLNLIERNITIAINQFHRPFLGAVVKLIHAQINRSSTRPREWRFDYTLCNFIIEPLKIVQFRLCASRKTHGRAPLCFLGLHFSLSLGFSIGLGKGSKEATTEKKTRGE